MKKRYPLFVIALSVVLFSYTSEVRDKRGNNDFHYLFNNFASKDFDQVKSNFFNLINKGVDINKANVQNETPIGQLYYSTQSIDDEDVRNNVLDIITYAIHKKLIDINVPCYGRNTLVDLACRANDVSFIELLINFNLVIQKDKLHKFAVQNNLEDLIKSFSPQTVRKNMTEDEILEKHYGKYDGLTCEEIAAMDHQESGSSSRRGSFSGDDGSSEEVEVLSSGYSCIIM